MQQFHALIQTTSLRLDFTSSYLHVDTAVATVRAFLQHAGVPYDEFALHLVLREGLTNAVKHGNHEQPQRRVRCEVRLEPEALHIAIADEGAGFCWQRYYADEVGPGVPHGRGLWLMRAYGFDVSHTTRGNVLFLRTALPQQ